MHAPGRCIRFAAPQNEPLTVECRHGRLRLLLVRGGSRAWRGLGQRARIAGVFLSLSLHLHHGRATVRAALRLHACCLCDDSDNRKKPYDVLNLFQNIREWCDPADGRSSVSSCRDNGPAAAAAHSAPRRAEANHLNTFWQPFHPQIPHRCSAERPRLPLSPPQDRQIPHVRPEAGPINIPPKTLLWSSARLADCLHGTASPDVSTATREPCSIAATLTGRCSPEAREREVGPTSEFGRAAY